MKVFLSIGSGPGMGIATAERFAKEGFKVILANRKSASKLVESLVSKGYQAEAKAVDASDSIQVAALVSEVEKQYGKIDVLHYNAANIRQATITSQPNETFVGDLAINIGNALSAVQAALPKMAESKSGTVLLTGGGFALHPSPDYLSISIGKAGIRAMTLGLFDSLKDQNVHIATVTVATFVNPDSKEANDVAEEFWKLHAQPAGQWTAETIYPAG